MKIKLVRLISFVLCVALVLPLAGCSERVAPANVSETFKGASLPNGEKIENEKLSLTWDSKNNCVILTEKATGNEWTTSPYGYLDKEKKKTPHKKFLESPLLINYRENWEYNDEMSPDDNIVEYSYRTYSDKLFSVTKEDNSFVIKYCLKESNSIIPVRFTLKEDCIAISINTSEIIENEDPLFSLTFMPTFCAVEKGTEDSYIFYPSGTGAIIDTSNPGLPNNKYSAGIYGDDAARKERVRGQLTNQKQVYMPVFGTVIGDKGICGIVSKGAEHATLHFDASFEDTGYSAVYTRLWLRGWDANNVKGNLQNDETEIFSKDMIEDSVYEVEYYPLSGEDAGYTGMAKLYQEKLFGDNKATEIKEDVYSLKIYGGLLEGKNFLGYPYSTLLAVTTYKDVSNMLNDLSSTGVTPNIQLYGFGESGLDVGKVAGGFALGGAFGSKKELSNLTEYCKEKGIDMFVDFNLLYFGSSSLGYNTTFDSAKTANKQSAFAYYVDKEVQNVGTSDYSRFRLLKRDKVIKASDTLLKKIKKYNLTGVSFASLSDTAYSDYSSSKYYMKKDMPSFAQNIINKFKESGKKFAANGANAYAAQIADVVFETPLNSSELDMFYTDVPFYQMVFKGKTEITSEAVNAGESLNKKVLQALESGSSILFNIYNTYDTTLTYSPFKGLYGAMYADNAQTIKRLASEHKGYYEAISGQTIVNHELVDGDRNIRCTTYSNGVKMYVNYSSAVYEVSEGIIPAGGYMLIK